MRPAVQTVRIVRWPRVVLAGACAFFAGCPVLSNLVSTYVADGQSFAITAAIAISMLLALVIALVRIGMPAPAGQSMLGTIQALAAVGALFWSHWILINLISPSPQEQMHYQVLQAGIWLLAPLVIFVIWRDWLDPYLVIRMMILVYAVFIIGLAARWALDLGFYQSGRWHAGKSLEAIRCGRYATFSLWVFGVSLLCPARAVSARYKAVAVVCLPLSVLMMIAANARGPWLAMAITLLMTSVPLGRLLYARISKDARILAAVGVGLLVVLAFVATQISRVQSDFDRLFTLTNDGGSAEGRITLVHDHLHLLHDTPLAIISGTGYSHGYFYPHNVLIEAMVNGGLLSLALLLSMIAITLYAWLWQSRRDDVPCLLFVGLFLLSLCGSEVSGSIASDLTWFFPLLVVLAVLRGGPKPITAPAIGSAPSALATSL